ncbi:MAG: hypothetical protein JW804_05210 [Sedimentisphaerales bacterium]|nr:hypothetical protein [Sedimentisphaerales bacterium]
MKNHQSYNAVLAATAASLILLFLAWPASAQDEVTHHFKMISSLEYSGKGQFKHRTESLFTVHKTGLPEDELRHYTVSMDEPDSSIPSSFDKVVFVIDKASGYLLMENKDLQFFELIHNDCVRSLTTAAKDNIGKTWKQSFDLPSLDTPLPGRLKFTVTAARLQTSVLGDMIAARALSEPFAFDTAGATGKAGKVTCKVNAVYVFDPEMEDIYLSVSVFEATTTVNGFKETLRHELATYMTDDQATPLDFSGLGKNFEKPVRKVGLIDKDIKIKNPTHLPEWVRRDGLRVTGLANTCAALACEGASNPAVTICIPGGRMVAMQGLGHIASSTGQQTVAGLLARRIEAISSMKLAAPSGFMGMSYTTVGAIVGGTVGGVAAGGGGGGGGGGGANTPTTP